MEAVRAEIKAVATEIATTVAKEAAKEAATLAVTETLQSFGLDTKDRRETMKDFIFLGEMRKTVADSRRQVLLTIVGMMGTGIVGALLVYAKTVLTAN